MFSYLFYLPIQLEKCLYSHAKRRVFLKANWRHYLNRWKRAADELEGKNSDKQGGTCSIIETKLGLQAKS
jgi:hypothetical protein